VNQSFMATLETRKNLIDEVLEDYFQQTDVSKAFGVQELKRAMEYSALRGGKRFRPVLSLLIAEAFGVGPQRVLPLACAIEFIHTYSLIHDDLPCMDNDDIRRGEPTNHKVFGETTALLAGDALLTEAFLVLSHSYENEPQVAVQLIALLSKAAGIQGMVGGQAIDLKSKDGNLTQADLVEMHAKKTGALIRIAAEGAGVACELTKDKTELCRKFGEALGLAFQIADDLLDSSGAQIEKGSFPGVLGFEQTKNYLGAVSEECFTILKKLGIENGPLCELIDYNRTRSK
jgi:geranylgeranyl diphosphate synthase type II